MAYRNKTYVGLDYDEDKRWYNAMRMWKANDNIEFDFHNAHELNTIRSWSTEDAKKQALRQRMLNAKLFVLLVGGKTRFQQTYVRWEIDQALKMDLPIIAVNLNGTRRLDSVRCPLILRSEIALHIPFNQSVMTHAMDKWPGEYASRKQLPKDWYFYEEPFYSSRGL